MHINDIPIQRGYIVYCDIGKTNIRGCEQQGDRPYIVVQNNIGNKHSNTFIAVPVTTERKKPQSTHVKLYEFNGVANNSIALCEQIRTLDKCRISRYMGCLTPNQMEQLNKALTVSLGLY